MHLNYHFLIHLVNELKPKLIGSRLDSCYSQNKDELIFSFDGGNDTFFFRALLSGTFTCLTFPEEHHRAKRNSVDLFEEIIGKAVTDISLVTNDRSFIMHLSENYELLFKLHGNRSNIILYHEGSFISMFNNQLKKDEGILPSTIAKPNEVDLEKWLVTPVLKNLFPTFGPRVLDHLKKLGFEGLPPDKQWSLIEKARSAMNDAQYHIAIDGKGVPY
ncbi:MAG: NFACT family protein, partial [Bacteroidota bacterium]